MGADTCRTLSEAESKNLLGAFGIAFARESRAPDTQAALEAAADIGFPVALKLNGDTIAHKTERGLVRLGLSDSESLAEAAEALLALGRPEDGPVDLLVAEMVVVWRQLARMNQMRRAMWRCSIVSLNRTLQLAEVAGSSPDAASHPS